MGPGNSISYMILRLPATKPVEIGILPYPLCITIPIR